jgi:hypothetical protein
MSFARTTSVSGKNDIRRVMASQRMAQGESNNIANGASQDESTSVGQTLQEVRSIRDLNQMRLSMTHPDIEENNGLLEYKAYLRGDFNMNVSLPMEDYGFNPSNLVTAITNVVGFAPAFDMPRYFMFKGSKPISFTLSTYLKIDSVAEMESLSKEVPEGKVQSVMDKYYGRPLRNLFGMFLPSSGTSNVLQTIKEITPDAVSNVLESVGEFLSDIPLFANDSAIKQRLDEVFPMYMPPAIDPKLSSRIKLQMGKYGESSESYALTFDQVIITNVSVEWSKLLIDKGYPDRMGVDITLETLRPATAQIVNDFLATKE